MKKNLILTIVSILVISLMFMVISCKEEPTSEEITEEVEEATEEVAEEVEETAEEEILIGVVLGDLGNSIHRLIGSTMEDKAAEMGGRVILKDTQANATKLVEVLENFIAAGCDIIVQQNTDQTISEAVNTQAREAGIKIVSFDVEMELADVCYVADNYTLGYKTGAMAGEWANEQLGGEAQFGLLTASQFDFILVRQQGIEEGLAETSPNSKIVIEDDAITVIDGSTATDIFLQAYPELNGVIGITDANILGAYESYKVADKVSENVGLFSCDLSDAGAEAVKEGSIFRGAIFLSPVSIGIAMTEDAFLLAGGEKPDEKIKYFPMEPVNSDNIEEVIGD